MSRKETGDPDGKSSKDKRHFWGRPNSEAAPTDLYLTTDIQSAVERTWKSPYVYANVVYIAYASLILSVDLQPDLDYKTIDDLFLAAALVHLVNAFMYVYVWIHAGYSLRNPLLIADYLNIGEAALYLVTACLYRYENHDEESSSFSSSSSSSSSSIESILSDSPDRILSLVHIIELVAAIVQLFAALGWVTQWYLTYQRVPGRGYTLDDPDIWANVTIVLPSIIYVIYNFRIQLYPEEYYTNFSYILADKIYLSNAIFYFLGGMRDVGWFWFMPTAGKFPKSASYNIPLLDG